MLRRYIGLSPVARALSGIVAQRSPDPCCTRLGSWGHGSLGSRSRPRSPPPVVHPSRSAQCRSYRLGSALVDSAVGGCSACDSPLGGRSWPAASRASADAPALELVLDLADAGAQHLLAEEQERDAHRLDGMLLAERSWKKRS